MRFYQDNCERLLDVQWYFVERTDFVPSTPYCSSVYDEEPDMEGLPVGELAATRQHRIGSIPLGTGISPAYKGTPAQWAGAINVADRVRPADVCGPATTHCSVALQSVLSWSPPCPAIYQDYPLPGWYADVPWNAVNAPVVSLGGFNVPMQFGNPMASGVPMLGPWGTMKYWWGVIPCAYQKSVCPLTYSDSTCSEVVGIGYERYLIWEGVAFNSAGGPIPGNCGVFSFAWDYSQRTPFFMASQLLANANKGKFPVQAAGTSCHPDGTIYLVPGLITLVQQQG